MQHHGESPYDARWFERPDHDDRITDPHRDRAVPVGTHEGAAGPRHPGRSDRAVLVRASDDQLAEIYPCEDWILARSTSARSPTIDDEFDLFDGSGDECRT